MLVKITAFDVIPLDESHRKIVRHERLYGEHKQQSMQWLPYLIQLSRRPGALKYTGIYQMLPDPVKHYLDKCSKNDKGKVLKAIAALTERSSFERAVETVSTALSYVATDVDSLLNLHYRLYGETVQLEPVKVPAHIPQLEKYVPNLAAYDENLKKAGVQEC